MRIAMTAETEHWTFALDDEGFCRSVMASATRDGEPLVRPLTREAHEMLGAQFLGAIDHRVPGGVAAEPRIGAPMLFGYVDADSRIRLLRTGQLLGFEALGSAAGPGLHGPVEPASRPLSRQRWDSVSALLS